MNTENIQKFLMPPDEGGAYTDEKLAALLAHAQDGKLSYESCCCLIGTVTANHALTGDDYYCGDGGRPGKVESHLVVARETLPFAVAAEQEFLYLCRPTSKEGRERLIPLILAEMERREKRQPQDEEVSDVRAEIEVYRGR